eukprot:CAMPEP_0178638610 /NCGR_PEP_ID=MMETSP0698-20121128/14991_1 /TAXON_ID=265572 /ORGANISM="Extubocellulus spinifer, Strain CCMP396" /LENGTH=85 /DNA_ID=CAMNT_0020278827 /DNA_START=274 /DNA_END=531 /DNA_ORIENTATION=-
MGKTDAEYQQMFKKYDKNNSGYIDPSDVKKITHGALSDSAIDKLIGFGDKKKDGRLDFNEFKSLMKKIEMAKKMLSSASKSTTKK